jgi:2'-5' RNA ligase
MEVKKIYLKSSKLTPNGPIYKNIKEFNLWGKKYESNCRN